jgi:hypothetical protein
MTELQVQKNVGKDNTMWCTNTELVVQKNEFEGGYTSGKNVVDKKRSWDL